MTQGEYRLWEPEPASHPSSNGPLGSLNASVISCLEDMRVCHTEASVRRLAAIATTRMLALQHPVYSLSEVRKVHGIGAGMFAHIQDNFKHLPPVPSTYIRWRPPMRIFNKDILAFLADLSTRSHESYVEGIYAAMEIIRRYPRCITQARAAKGVRNVNWWVSVRIDEFFNSEPTPSCYLKRFVGPLGPGTSAGVGFPVDTRSVPEMYYASEVGRAAARNDASREGGPLSYDAPYSSAPWPHPTPVMQPAGSAGIPDFNAGGAELTPETPFEEVRGVASGPEGALKKRWQQQHVAERPVGGGSAERAVVPAYVDHREHGVLLEDRLQSGGVVQSPVANRTMNHTGQASRPDVLTAGRARETREEDVGGGASPPSGRTPANDVHISGLSAVTRDAIAGGGLTPDVPYEGDPPHGSAGYALLMGFLNAPGRGMAGMEIVELVNLANRHMAGPTTLWDKVPGMGMRTIAGDAMAWLIRDGLVERTSGPLRFHLTIAGLAVAHRIAPPSEALKPLRFLLNTVRPSVAHRIAPPAPATVDAAPEQNPGPVLVSLRGPTEADNSSVCKTDTAPPSMRTASTPTLGPAPMGADSEGGLCPSHESGDDSPAKPALSMPSYPSVAPAVQLDASTPSTFETKNGNRWGSREESSLEASAATPAVPPLPVPTYSSNGLSPLQTGRGESSPSPSQSEGAPVPLVSATRPMIMRDNRKRGSTGFEAAAESPRNSPPMSPPPFRRRQPGQAQSSNELAAPRTTWVAPSPPSIAAPEPLASGASPSSRTKKQKRACGAMEISSGSLLTSAPGSSVPISPYQLCPKRSSSQLTYARGMGLVLVAEGLPRARVKAAIDAFLQADAGLCMDADAFCARVRAIVAAPPLPTVDLDDPAAEARAASAVATVTAKLASRRCRSASVAASPRHVQASGSYHCQTGTNSGQGHVGDNRQSCARE